MRYRDELVALGETLADGADPSGQAVWEAYAGTEKLIAVLRFRLDYETPGLVTRLPDAKDPEKLLEDARQLLSRAADQVLRGKLVEAIETMRKARNNLRSYLVDSRRSATRAGRKEVAKPKA